MPEPEEVNARYLSDLEEVFVRQYKKGLQKYGTPLMTFNGRDAGNDAMEEYVDLGNYITQIRMEREALEDRIKELENEVMDLKLDLWRCGGNDRN